MCMYCRYVCGGGGGNVCVYAFVCDFVAGSLYYVRRMMHGLICELQGRLTSLHPD